MGGSLSSVQGGIHFGLGSQLRPLHCMPCIQSIHAIHHASSLSYLGLVVVQCRQLVPCIATAALSVSSTTVSQYKRWLSSKANAPHWLAALLSLSPLSSADVALQMWLCRCGFLWCSATHNNQAKNDCSSCRPHGILFSPSALSRHEVAFWLARV